jgi:hypothetical protein
MPHQHPFSIRMFIPNGDSDGLRIVEKSNWTGVGVVLKRSNYKQLSSRQEADRTGVYILVGDPVEGAMPNIYVGEGDPVKRRLDAHYRNKEFWDWAVLFTSKDSSLNKAHVKHLEARLLILAADAKRCHLENNGASLAPTLSEAETADMESFLADIKSILPLVGLSVFEQSKGATSHNGLVLHLHSKRYSARGYEDAEGFVVCEGSEVSSEESDSIHGYMKKLRAELIQQGVIVDLDSVLVFAQDYTFGSPSTASGVILGRADNGRTSWRDKSGTTLKELQEALLDDN